MLLSLLLLLLRLVFYLQLQTCCQQSLPSKSCQGWQRKPWIFRWQHQVKMDRWINNLLWIITLICYLKMNYFKINITKPIIMTSIKLKLTFSTGKVKDMVSKASQPCVSEVAVEWQNFGNEEGIVQAPSHVSSIFSGSRQVIFGFVLNCTMVNCRCPIINWNINYVNYILYLLHVNYMAIN